MGNKAKVFTFKMLNAVKTLRSEFKMFFLIVQEKSLHPILEKRDLRNDILVKILKRATERPIV